MFFRLKEAANRSNNQYHDECFHGRNPHANNMCYLDKLKVYNYPFENRKIGPICLLPFSKGLPLRHSFHNLYQTGDLVWHMRRVDRQRYENIKQLKFDGKYIVYPDGFVIKSADENNPHLYLMKNGTKHRIPDWDTFVDLKLSRRDIFHLSEIEFSRIPAGQEIPTKSSTV